MDQSTLVEEWKEAGKLFLADFSRNFPLKAAFWLKEGEDGPWYLYVASEKITDQNRGAAYTEAGRSARRVHFDPFRVKIVRSDDPLVKAALCLQPSQPSPFGTYYDVALPGISGAEGAYFYPPTSTAAN
jgi:hypothetical protein